MSGRARKLFRPSQKTYVPLQQNRILPQLSKKLLMNLILILQWKSVHPNCNPIISKITVLIRSLSMRKACQKIITQTKNLTFYPRTVHAVYDSGKHVIKYDDDDKDSLILNDQKWQLDQSNTIKTSVNSVRILFRATNKMCYPKFSLFLEIDCFSIVKRKHLSKVLSSRLMRLKGKHSCERQVYSTIPSSKRG